MTARLIDVSVMIKDGMVYWPGDVPVHIERVHEIGGKFTSNLSKLDMGAHTGTHMDAPFHFIAGGRTIDTLPLETTIGPARVIEIKDAESIKSEELKKHKLRKGERILFKTKNSARCWKTDEFITDYVYFSTEAAKYLASIKPVCVGVDYLSVGGYKKNGTDVHRAILGAGIWIIEGLNLSKVKPGKYELICLPLKVLDADGAPARAVLKQAGK